MQILIHIGLLYFVKKNDIIYFDSFGVEHIPEEIKEFIGNKNIKANIFRVQANDSIKVGYFYIGFINFILAGKTLSDYTIYLPLMILIKMTVSFSVILKMHEIDKTKLSDQTKFRLYEIKKLKIILSTRLMKQNHTVKN